ncbi:MAG TPA: glutathione-regulated potassium-efflux system protein KefC [Polyangia bacterium]|nr:glutathione-regulated potassium-efflux system protein KefC [Polyangia bacterium]
MPEHNLLFEVMVYLGAAVVFVPLATRFKLGSVLGYLIAGCAIGPWGLRLVRDVDAILHFAEFGVVLMLFIIGLELDPKRLLEMRRPIFLGGSLQMFVCGVLLAVGGFALGLPWKGALVGGFALALSSTAIAVQTMRERGVAGAPTGTTAFAVLLFQDIAAIPLIAVVPLLAAGAGGHGGGGWLGAARVAGAIAAVVVVGRYLTRPILRMVARTGLREAFTAFALLLVVGIAQIMAAAGVSMALGAFLAGVLLASSEYRHALETDIEPFKGLLMGLFFIAVGMSIDFGLVASRPLVIVALVVGLLAIKLLALRAIGKPLGVAPGDRWLFAALLAQGGEFAFVVFGVAGEAHLLPGAWDALLTLVVALSMALTPFLLLAYDQLLRLARRRGSSRPDDVVEDEGAPVVIAGFGRFGQIVGRYLFASGIRATVLDHDADQIDLLRKFGFRVFYGDATRLDLLRAAGAEHAKLLVLAIDDPDASVRLAEVARQHFPKLRVIARARNVSHWVALRKRGVDAVERETFESALRSGRAALVSLGVGAYEARERADRFRRHNLANLEELMPHFEDEADRFSRARAGREQLEAQIAADRAELDRSIGGSWSAERDHEPKGERAPAESDPAHEDRA